MLYAIIILKSLELKVKLFLLLEIYNKGTVYLINKWVVVGINRHVEARQLFLHEMKEQGNVQVIFIVSDNNEVSFYTKNFPGSLFDMHRVKFN